MTDAIHFCHFVAKMSVSVTSHALLCEKQQEKPGEILQSIVDLVENERKKTG